MNQCSAIWVSIATTIAVAVAATTESRYILEKFEFMK